MTRLWRAVTLAVIVSTLVLGPGAAAFADDGDRNGRTETTREQGADRGNHDVAPGPSDEAGNPDSDPVTDRIRDREREQDRVGDREMDRDRDRLQRPECDRETDRERDCRPSDELRPLFARCIEWIQNQTDHVIHRSLRWWWQVCHRLAWNHANPA